MSDQSYVITPELGKAYPVVSHGKGVYLYDNAGRRYLDGSSGAIAASLGHGIPEIVEAMRVQAERVTFVHRSHFISEPVMQLAEKLAEWSPGNLRYAFFVNSGSEATETAHKIAIQYWQELGYDRKTRVLSRWMSYHGITTGALSMSGHVLRRRRFVPLLADYPSVSPPYCYRCPWGQEPANCLQHCLDEMEAAIRRIGPEYIAAFIAEPVIGAAGGAVVPPEGYFQRIREICDRYQILFIADEVMTGCGRTGKNFGIDHWGVVPDLMAIGKGMSGGYTPQAAVLVTEEIHETIRKGTGFIMAGHTYSANPLSSAVSLAVLRFMEAEGLVDRARQQGDELIADLRTLQKEIPLIGDVRGKGLLCGVEFVKDPVTKEPFPLQQGVTQRILEKAFQKGLLLYPASGGLDGIAGDAILVAPPLIIRSEERKELVELLRQTLLEVQEELHKAGWLA